MVMATMASTETYSAKPSRAGCQQISGTPSPRSAISRRWISSPCSPTEASVPAAPANCPTNTRGAACSSALDVAAHLGQPDRHLEAEGDGQGVLAVGAAGQDRVALAAGQIGQRLG